VITRYHERADDAGRLTSRWQRELASLWVFLREQGVDPTTHRAEVRSVDQKPSLQLGGWVLG
jgi:hypothetical protein